MPKTVELKLRGWTAELGKGHCGHLETDSNFHNKLNDEWLGFELWTPECPTKDEAEAMAIMFADRILRAEGVEYDASWQ